MPSTAKTSSCKGSNRTLLEDVLLLTKQWQQSQVILWVVVVIPITTKTSKLLKTTSVWSQIMNLFFCFVVLGNGRMDCWLSSKAEYLEMHLHAVQHKAKRSLLERKKKQKRVHNEQEKYWKYIKDEKGINKNHRRRLQWTV